MNNFAVATIAIAASLLSAGSNAVQTTAIYDLGYYSHDSPMEFYAGAEQITPAAEPV